MTADGVWAVVTSYRPEAGLLRALTALSDQVDQIVVVDDGSGPEAAPVLEAAQSAGSRVVRLRDNSGIAVALNAGIRAALDQGARAVVTFDQDSVVQAGFVRALLTARDAVRRTGRRHGPVVPEYFADVRQVHSVEHDGTLVARHAIQSGMLLDRELLETVGLMREDLFIDLVDTEFELRCAAAGLPTIAAPGLTLAHALGRQYERRMLGRIVRLPGIPPVVTLSNPFRYYYRVRNRLVVNREFWRAQFGWVARDTLLEALHYGNALLLARPRRALWRLYLSAARDARRGRMGRMPSGLAELASTISWAAPPAE
ncbi:glycosyltransferase [Microbacterium sp. zg.B48]|uniref:glycosyltransferase n=1 Tax=Microbacterium sp. zg.B48 TaxID=2969408 RepID=UPI00214C259E|nr:glycosyltransferase [Microbacterium sp. zg.B48]MCR2764614.1 glycosyltransferase [Microbacterium sp. zg.B48]